MPTVFARFDDRDRADKVIARLSRDQRGKKPIAVFLHEGGGVRGAPSRIAEQVQHSRDLRETDLRHGMLVGIVTGLVAGPLVGAALAGFFGLAPSVLSGAGLGALTGVLVGVLVAGLIGAGLMDRRLAKLADHLGPGDVMVTFEVPDDATKLEVEALIGEHGGRFEEKLAI